MIEIKARDMKRRRVYLTQPDYPNCAEVTLVSKRQDDHVAVDHGGDGPLLFSGDTPLWACAPGELVRMRNEWEKENGQSDRRPAETAK